MADTHRCHFPDTRLLENRAENTEGQQLRTWSRTVFHGSWITDFPTNKPVPTFSYSMDSPCWVSQRSPVHPASQKHAPVPLRPASQDPCSEQLQAENQVKKRRLSALLNMWTPSRKLSPLLTFTGGAIESLTAQFTGDTPKTSVTGTGSVTQVTIITFTAITAGRADSTGTD